MQCDLLYTILILKEHGHAMQFYVRFGFYVYILLFFFFSCSAPILIIC